MRRRTDFIGTRIHFCESPQHLFSKSTWNIANVLYPPADQSAQARKPLRNCKATFLFVVVLAILLGNSSTASLQSGSSNFEQAYRANNIGVALLEQYKAREATQSFTEALRLQPDLFIARINLAIALFYSEQVDAAKREAEKAAAQSPTAPQPHYLLGLIARSKSDYEGSIEEFLRVLHADPSDVGSNVNLGQLYVQQKQYAEAIVAFRNALTAEPYNETALYNLGLLLT
ncbi:MAG: tetratricopeptide repeat protein, partial [Pyrinomonadaceae bacterium]